MEIALRGGLKYFKLPEILTFLNLGGKTGALNLNHDGSEVSIYVDGGSVVYASTNQKKFRLAQILLKKNKISSSQWKNIEEIMLQEQQKFGSVAVEQNLLSKDELDEWLKIQASEIVYDCFIWNDGKFSFWSGMQLPEYAVTISLDHVNLVMEGARRIDELDYLNELLPDKSAILRITRDPASVEQLVLTVPEWETLCLIDGKRNLQEVCREAQGTALDVLKAIYGFYTGKIIDVCPPPPTRDPVQKMPDETLLVSPSAKMNVKSAMETTFARLILKKGDKTQQNFFLIEKEYLIGNKPGNHIYISDPQLSNVHAVITRDPKGYVLKDRNSKTGTFVNGIQIHRKVLQTNDEIRVGNTTLTYNIVLETNSGFGKKKVAT